jgi:hypothetical protein
MTVVELMFNAVWRKLDKHKRIALLLHLIPCNDGNEEGQGAAHRPRRSCPARSRPLLLRSQTSACVPFAVSSHSAEAGPYLTSVYLTSGYLTSNYN